MPSALPLAVIRPLIEVLIPRNILWKGKQRVRMHEKMVGIVILNYNSWDDTRECIQSIQTAEQMLDYRIYLVDNCLSVRPDSEWLQNQTGGSAVHTE